MESLMERKTKRWEIVEGEVREQEEKEELSLKDIKEAIAPLSLRAIGLRTKLRELDLELERLIKIKWRLEEKEILREKEENKKEKKEPRKRKRKFTTAQLAKIQDLTPEEYTFLKNL